MASFESNEVSDDHNYFMLSDTDTKMQNLFECLTLDSKEEDFQFWQAAKQKLHKRTKNNIRLSIYYYFIVNSFNFVLLLGLLPSPPANMPAKSDKSTQIQEVFRFFGRNTKHQRNNI